MILVTGGAGFIGSNFILEWLAGADEMVLNIDCLTYAGNLDNLRSLQDDPRHVFVKTDICDTAAMAHLLVLHQPRAIVHFAAESHVDRSIDAPATFVTTNIQGTFSLLTAARQYWRGLSGAASAAFRYLQVSTDEVYGSLLPDASPFTEAHSYAPNNPYAASKAAADHLVRACHRTYGLPVLTTISSNNYGPYHHPEKLIPLTIVNALAGRQLPIYGDGQQRRDWLYVSDNCAAIRRVLEAGRIGEAYNIGGACERANLEVVHTICRLLDDLVPREGDPSYQDQITAVPDRVGHDRRYAIDFRKIEQELGWKPVQNFEAGIRSTVQWYLDNQDWIGRVQARS
ncbi:MAG: dTDP-glucose 4,6-dehydratase [Pseudomonadota bacterium]